MTVGASRPVKSTSCTRPIARSAKLFNASGAACPCFATSPSNFSKYMRIVAPADPVPLNLNTTLAGSPLGYLNDRVNPWLVATEPSTGSVYLLSAYERQGEAEYEINQRSEQAQQW